MGSSGSKIVKKIFRPTSNTKDERQKYNCSSSQARENGFEVDPVVAKLPPSLGPLVMYRQGSMYFDEDGDLAHEFYVEVKEGRKSKMKRVYDNLRPQANVYYVRKMFDALDNQLT